MTSLTGQRALLQYISAFSCIFDRTEEEEEDKEEDKDKEEEDKEARALSLYNTKSFFFLRPKNKTKKHSV